MIRLIPWWWWRWWSGKEGEWYGKHHRHERQADGRNEDVFDSSFLPSFAVVLPIITSIPSETVDGGGVGKYYHNNDHARAAGKSHARAVARAPNVLNLRE